MIRDLLTDQADQPPVDADVLVIGAGTAGLLIATRLAGRGRRVVVLESGGAQQAAETHPLNQVEQTGTGYLGAEAGRFRCLGGTSTRWGGVMVPFLAEDVGPHTAGWVDDWGLPWSRLLSHLGDLEQRFHLPPGPYEDPDLLGPVTAGFCTRLAKVAPVRLRNVATAFQRELRAETGATIWLNAHVTEIVLDESGRAAGAIACAPSGATLNVRAQDVVVAAGTIETTRILLLLDRQHDERIFAPDDVLGRYFNDHISAPIARLDPPDRFALMRLTSFRFDRAGSMRNVRFEMTGPARKAARVPASFMYVYYEGSSEGDGLGALRAVYNALQSRRRPTVAELLAVARHAPWFAQAVWWRFAEKRLLYPANGRFLANLVVEQSPERDNRISLAKDRTDRFGQPLASIHWRVVARDLDAFGRLAEAFVDMWDQSRLGSVAKAVPIPSDDWQAKLTGSGDIFHPAGTVRIGKSPAEGVVGSDLTTFRVPNLHVASTAAFPVVGGANPTMTLLLCACELADRLAATTRHALDRALVAPTCREDGAAEPARSTPSPGTRSTPREQTTPP